VNKKPGNLGEIFDKHLEFEFEKEDVDTTMTTMTEERALIYTDVERIQLTYGRTSTRPTEILLNHEF
jgi:hypothetical protein